MAQHDPVNFASGLSARLAARSRHVCVFLGAGASKACGLPDVNELQKKVIASLPNEEGASFQKLLANRGLEQALSRIRRISSLVENADTVDGLTREAANKLDQLVCREIIKNLVIPAEDSSPMSLLAAWLRRANYVLPVEVFTVNYDLLIEGALDQLKVPYFDGFVGTIRASFQTEMAEALSPNDRDWLPAYFVRLWKLHGSVNWEWDKKNVVRLGRAVDSGVPAAIYPSDTKYDESRRVPFVVLQDRLRRSLHLPETILLVSGYSFGDDHLNELIFDAATRRERSEVIVFCRSKIPPALAVKAETTPNIQVVCAKEAIMGGVKGEWLAPTDPAAGIWADEQFTLGDFKQLAAFLARSTPGDTSPEKLLQDAFESLIVTAAPNLEASNAGT